MDYQRHSFGGLLTAVEYGDASAITALKEFTTLRAAGRPVAIERHPEKGWRVRDLSRDEDYAGRSGT